MNGNKAMKTELKSAVTGLLIGFATMVTAAGADFHITFISQSSNGVTLVSTNTVVHRGQNNFSAPLPDDLRSKARQRFHVLQSR